MKNESVKIDPKKAFENLKNELEDKKNILTERESLLNSSVTLSKPQIETIKFILSAPSECPDYVIQGAYSYCKANNLDIMKKHIAIIKYGNKYEYVFTIQSKITVAARSGWAGNDDYVFGEIIEHDSLKIPEWAQITVYKLVQGVICKFVGQKVYFKERYKQRYFNANGKEIEGAWQKQPISQLCKCALSASLGRAFPECSDMYIGEEMQITNHEKQQNPIDKSSIDFLGEILDSKNTQDKENLK